jgi:hypothetical protein
VPSNADISIVVTVEGIKTSPIEVAPRKACLPIEVTPKGISRVPTQPVFLVITSLMIVNVPLVPQLMFPSATAFAVPGIAAQSSVPIIAVSQYLFTLKQLRSGEMTKDLTKGS